MMLLNSLPNGVLQKLVLALCIILLSSNGILFFKIFQYKNDCDTLQKNLQNLKKICANNSYNSINKFKKPIKTKKINRQIINVKLADLNSTNFS